MKIAILGDLHLGARNSSAHFSSYFNSFFTDIFYPYCLANDISSVIQLGDLFDNRTSVSLKAFHACRDTWFGGLRKHGIHMYTLLGNHDIHFRESLVINSPELFLGEYRDCVTIINKPTALRVGDFSCDVVPWICEENLGDVSQFIEREDRNSIVFGHFEFGGFKMQANSPLTTELDSSAKLFSSRYKKVISGHYHTRSENGNILYTGIPYQITWSDYGDPKGFHILDTETGAIEFVVNPYTMFTTSTMTETQKMPSDPMQYRGKMVKCFYDSSLFDKQDIDRYCIKLRSSGPLTLTIHDTAVISLNTSGDIIDSSDLDTRSVINNYVSDRYKGDMDTTNAILKIMTEVYDQAVVVDRLAE